jgi:hypothetical protein
MNGVRLPQSPVAEPSDLVSDPLLTPPRGLPRDQRTYWIRYAPFALAQRTLTAAHVPGFRELCEQAARKDKLMKEERTLERQRDAEEVHKVRKEIQAVTQRLETKLLQFKLTGMGRPAESQPAAAAVSVNAWAQVAGQ